MAETHAVSSIMHLFNGSHSVDKNKLLQTSPVKKRQHVFLNMEWVHSKICIDFITCFI